MSTLVIQLPEHRRLRARATGDALPDPGRRREYVYVTSADGIEFEAQGDAAAALLPRASQVVSNRSGEALARAIEDAWLDREAIVAEQKRWVRAHASIETATRELERVYATYVRPDARPLAA